MTQSSQNLRSRHKVAALLLARQEGQPGSEEAWQSHLALHPQDRALAEQMEGMWDRIGQVAPPALRLSPDEGPSGHVVPMRQPRRPFPRWALPVGIAASLAALVLARPLLPFGGEQAQPAAQIFAAGPHTRKLQLADGSSVTLAPGAQVAVTFTPDARRLELARGEAYFDVAHDAARPFTVTTPSGTITDIGTAFDLRVGTHETLVTVAQGTVRVAGRNNHAYRDVIRNQQIALQLAPDGSRGDLGAIKPVSGSQAGAWTGGWLRFEGVPLAQVVQEVNRYSPQQLVIGDAARAQVPVYGIFKVGEVDGLLTLMNAQPEIGPGVLKVESKP